MATATQTLSPWRGPHATMLIGTALMTVALAIAPLVGVYPVFLMKALCFGLFACAFNLLLGFGGLLSFGHAMFLGMAGYFCAHLAKVGLVVESITIKSVVIPIGIAIPPLPPELAILLAVAATTLLGLVT